MQNILVPLDGSSLAEAALPFASVLAVRAGANLTLVHAAGRRTLFGDIGVEQMHAIESGEDYLARIAAEIRANGVMVDTHVPLGGSPAEWIVEESEFRRKDLIVMATHDREGPDRWLHGSIAEAVVHHSTVPVMLVRATPDPPASQRFEMHQPKLLVPLDGSEFGDAALPFAGALARAIGARIVLLAVVPRPAQKIAGAGGDIVTYTGPEHATPEAEAWAHVQAGTAQLGPVAGIQSVVRYGSAITQIGEVAEDYVAAAVVMATHGRTGLLRSLVGSVAGGVVHCARVPVVLIRPTPLGRRAEPASRAPVAVHRPLSAPAGRSITAPLSQA